MYLTKIRNHCPDDRINKIIEKPIAMTQSLLRNIRMMLHVYIIKYNRKTSKQNLVDIIMHLKLV